MEDDTEMAQEQDQSRNNYINGARSSKRSKQKKVPQRGLGVAQLEKILEEQHMKDGVVILPSQNSIPSSSISTTISSYLPLPINNFNHSNHVKEGTFILPSQNSASSSSSSTTISNYLPLPITNYNLMNQNSSTNHVPLPPPLGEFRSPMSMQHIDGKVPSTVPLNNRGVFGNVPKMWNSHELDYDKEHFGVEHGLPFQPNSFWSMPNWVQRTPQFHHQGSSQVVNNTSGNSSIHVPQLSIEPPSNQNCSTNGGTPMRPAEKMMIGMKRPYPFSLDYPQASAINYKLSPFAETSSNARTSCENENGFHFDAGNSTSRESQSYSASNSEPNSKKRDKGVKDLDGSFLTLATSSTNSCPTSQFMSSKPIPLNKQKSTEENMEGQFHTPQGYRQMKQQEQPLYSFFIPAAQNGQTTSRIQNGQDVEENLDLILKL